MDGYGLWGSIATSTQALVVESGFPFWQIGLGLLMAFFLLFFIVTGLSSSLKWLLKKR